jgi:hypothetical protein
VLADLSLSLSLGGERKYTQKEEKYINRDHAMPLMKEEIGSG